MVWPWLPRAVIFVRGILDSGKKLFDSDGEFLSDRDVELADFFRTRFSGGHRGEQPWAAEFSWPWRVRCDALLLQGDSGEFLCG